MIDYLIVGSGLAGISFCRTLQQHKKTFLLYDDGSQRSSTVAAGLCNPVALKRFKLIWKAKAQWDAAVQFCREMEHDYACKIYHKIPIYRRFASIEEQNLWFEASDKPMLQDFLSTPIIKNKNACIYAPFSFGKLLHAAWVDVACLQNAFKNNLQQNQLLMHERFNYEGLKISENALSYKGINAKQIVFCDGFGLHKNPFFRYLPLQGTKGELITIKAPQLKLKEIIKSSVFIIPLGNDTYKVGATYNRDSKTQCVSPEGRTELLTKLKTLINCPFEVIRQEAGIRPTVIDRKPLAGTHPIWKRVHVLNGLGSRGVLLGPFVAQHLYHYIEDGIPLATAIDIQRFKNRYFNH